MSDAPRKSSGARAASNPAPRRRLPVARGRARERSAALKGALDALLSQADRTAAIRNDPVELVHRYDTPADQELVALLASAVAYGRVSLFKPRLSSWLPVLGASPARFAQESDPAAIVGAADSFTYRMTGPAELAALVAAAGRMQREHGSMGAFVERAWSESGGDLRAALARFVDELWAFDLTSYTGQAEPGRRLAHLVASPAGASACKRLNLFVRWMVRAGDGVDLGLWRLPASALVIPLDTHVHRIARLLGLTDRSDLSWRTAEEITARLRELDPDDPVKYDFALAHLGISGECRSLRDERICGPCALRPLCRVWRR